VSVLLAAIEAYYDAVPRRTADVESIGTFTLFVNNEGGWPFYARPTLGATTFTSSDVSRVLERQRALGVPEAFEWVAETSPGVRAAVDEAGLIVHDHPLMVLDQDSAPDISAPDGVLIRFVAPDEDLGRIGAVGPLSFTAPGTEVGSAGVWALAAYVAGRPADDHTAWRRRLRAGWTVLAAAFDDGQPVAIGSHQPVGTVTEVAGVATLPAYRRRGIAGAITRLLVQDAVSSGVRTVFLTAANDTVGRIYGRVGFRRIATACIAEAPDPPDAIQGDAT
jgi:ribosomal protein S18 acetylase RimI-like enzyme